MPKRPEQLEKEVLKAGFKLISGKGRGGHRRYEHEDGRTTEIPFHPGELRKFTEKKIRQQAGLK